MCLLLSGETDTEPRKFVYDGENILHVTDDADLTQSVYTLEPRQYGHLISQRNNDAGWVTSYHHFDALGSTDSLTDGSQVITDTYVYYAFGELKTSTGTTENPYTWVAEVGYWKDIDLDRFHLNAREYEPEQARFVSKDPLGYLLGPNPFMYVLNDSANRTDPSGLEADLKIEAVYQDGTSTTLIRDQSGQYVTQEEYDAARKGPPTFSADIVTGLIKDGLATRYLQDHQEYVLVADLAGDRIHAMLLERVTEVETRPIGIQNRDVAEKVLRSYDVYRTVMAKDLTPLSEIRRHIFNLDELLQRQRSKAAAKRFVDVYRDNLRNSNAQFLAQAAIFAYHMAPFGAAFDEAAQGIFREAGISLLGDVAFFLSGGTVLSVTRVTGLTAKTIGRIELAATAIEVTIGGYRAREAVLAVRRGDDLEAAGYFGEAFLRLFGASAAIIKQVKNRTSVAVALEHDAEQFAKQATQQAPDATKANAAVESLPGTAKTAKKFSQAGFEIEVLDSGADLVAHNVTFRAAANEGFMQTTFTKSKGDLYIDTTRSMKQKEGLGEQGLRIKTGVLQYV